MYWNKEINRVNTVFIIEQHRIFKVGHTYRYGDFFIYKRVISVINCEPHTVC
jgi:hypothetical protein